MTTTVLSAVDPDMAILEDLSSGQTILLPERPGSVIGLTIDESLTCVENEFAENDCVIALFHVTRKPYGDWLIPNPDLPCLVNDEEASSKVLLSQGTVVHVGDRFMRYHIPARRRELESGAPPKPSRMRSKSVVAEVVPMKEKTNRSFSITLADEWCIIDIDNEIASRQERLRAEELCLLKEIASSDPLIQAITSSEQLCSIVSSHICHQTMVYTGTPLSTQEIDDLFKYIRAMGPGNEMIMTKFVLEYHSFMSEEENVGRALHRPVVALLTDFLKITLEPLDQTEFWLHLLAAFSDVRENIQYFLQFGTTPVILGAMAASMASETVQACGCQILANVSSVLPNHNKKGPIRESAVELVLMAVRIHIGNENVIRPACRTLANVTQTYATLIGRILTPEPDDTMSEDGNAIDNLARWLGIMEVIQEYGLPIVDAISARYADDVVIPAECRRVVAFFRNNSFQTPDSSDDSSTDLSHLELQHNRVSSVITTPPSSNRSSISSLTDSDVVNDTNSINRVINQVMINCSASAIKTDEPGSGDRFSAISTSTYADDKDLNGKDPDGKDPDGKDPDGEHHKKKLKVPVIIVSDMTDSSSAVVPKARSEDTFEVVPNAVVKVEPYQMSKAHSADNDAKEKATAPYQDVTENSNQPKKEKKSAWKWFTKLFGANDEEDDGAQNGGKNSNNEETKKVDNVKFYNTITSDQKHKKKRIETVTKIQTNSKPVDLDYLVKKNIIHADMVGSFEDLYQKYANQDHVNHFTTIDLNNDCQTNKNIIDIQHPKTSTKFVTLQRQKFTLERQKQRLKTLKSVAKGIVNKSKRDSYTINQVDSFGNVSEHKTVNGSSSVVPKEPVQTLSVQITSTQKSPPTESSFDDRIQETPDVQDIKLPSVQNLAKLYEPKKTDTVKSTKQPLHKVQEECTEIRFDEKPISLPMTNQPEKINNFQANEKLLPSVQALSRIYERKGSLDIIPVTNPGYSKLRKRSLEIKSTQILERMRKEQLESKRDPFYLIGDSPEEMATSSDHVDSNEKYPSKDISGGNDLVESGEVKVFVTDNDVRLPGGIGASKC